MNRSHEFDYDYDEDYESPVVIVIPFHFDKSGLRWRGADTPDRVDESRRWIPD